MSFWCILQCDNCGQFHPELGHPTKPRALRQAAFDGWRIDRHQHTCGDCVEGTTRQDLVDEHQAKISAWREKQREERRKVSR